MLLVADGDWAVMAPSVGNIVAEMGLCGSGLGLPGSIVSIRSQFFWRGNIY